MADATTAPVRPDAHAPWWRSMEPYHWWVLAIGSMGWLFDCMAQRIFVMARDPAIASILGEAAAKKDVVFYGRIATGMVLLGWAVGGILFGILGDRIGRVKTMMVTILIYAGFTGISGASIGLWDFVLYRFLMGLGVGGLFGAAVSLVAEVTPPAARPHALGLLQALSAIGNIIASAIAYVLTPQTSGWFGLANWRWLFIVGMLPALVVVVLIGKTLKEPESWTRAKTRAAEDVQKQLGAWKDLFSPKLRRNSLVGLTLAVAGVIGLWGIAFFSPELIVGAMKEAGFDKSTQDHFKAIGGMLQDTGAFFGVYFFTVLATRWGRRPAFGLCFLLGFAAAALTFLSLRTKIDVLWMCPILGFCSLSVFGGYSIYFPELYPTRLRSSGVGFCYNVGRVITTAALFGSAYLLSLLEGFGIKEPLRIGSVLIAGIYFMGIVALRWAPETKDRPLQED